MSRILLLIPHPDDEIVGAAAAITRQRQQNHRFFGLYLTSGVPRAEQLWGRGRALREARVKQRRDEAIKVAALLGIEPIGFSDWPSRALKDHLAAAHRWIGKILIEHAIDAIWVPAWEGGHQDHDVANFLAASVADGRPVTEFAEYNRGGGAPRWQHFATPNGTETVLRLTPAEAAEKRRLIAAYRSERANLSPVRFQRESFRPLPRHDYTRPPHAGTLLRERFHWVGRFIHHPRIDHEPSANIYSALKAFRAAKG
jgi:N-acetylglucosamine malate deacetylase 1